MIATCPYCRTPVDEANQTLCPTCGTPHHADCWAENGGCTVFGCASAPVEEAKIHVSPADLGTPVSTALYHLGRGGQRHGPYTFQQLQEFQAQGNIGPADLLWTRGMPAWTNATAFLANPIVPGAPMPGEAAPVPGAGGPLPPDLHWGVVLLLVIVTCGLFFVVWLCIQGRFAKKLDPTSSVPGLLIAYVALYALSFVMAVADAETVAMTPLLNLVAIALAIGIAFSIRNSLEMYYNSTEPIHLRLNGVMVFFFNVIYLQYHLNRITEWKRTGKLWL